VRSVVRPLALAGLILPLLIPRAQPAPRSAPGTGARLVYPSEAAKSIAVLAGGCFWGVEAVYEHVRGVKSVVSGYAVPAAAPNGEPTMKPAKPGYVEAVRIEYDPGEISYARLLEIFFLVAHDPTQRDRQGPDIGPEYRSVVLVGNEADRGVATAYLDSLQNAKVFSRPITTEVAPLKSFKVAEDFHQDYVVRNPSAPYVVVNDLPKLQELRRRFPDLYRDR
jgi:peptide-methionine (S)-S-oxide reductase